MVHVLNELKRVEKTRAKPTSAYCMCKLIRCNIKPFLCLGKHFSYLLPVIFLCSSLHFEQISVIGTNNTGFSFCNLLTGFSDQFVTCIRRMPAKY